jgi:hypothetical protein
MEQRGITKALTGELAAVRHLVVLGFPRSGTSLLMTALGEHSGISMLDEDFNGAILRLAGSKIRGVKLCVPNQVQLDRKWDVSMRFHPVYRLLRLAGLLKGSTWRNIRPRSRLSLRDYAQLSHVSYICLLRDPARSLDAVYRHQRLSLPVRRAMWDLFIETLSALDANPDWDTVFLSFEQLVADPRRQLEALCARLDIEFEVSMLDAPRFNRRYPGAAFDAAKAGPADEIASAHELNLAAERLAAYERLLAKAL